MSKRIFAEITRGMTDKTAVCVFPWELPILQLIHGQDVKQRSIDEMCNVEKDAMKVERLRFKQRPEYPGHKPDMPITLREQLEVMQWVDPEEDPANDPVAEYSRMVELYGMDKEMPLACVARVYGEITSGAFTRVLAEHQKERVPKPAALKARDEGLGKSPSKMSVGELRAALNERGIEWTVSDAKAELVKKLEEVLVE